MIPFMKPFIRCNPVPNDISFVSRADFIRALPELLQVELTSPSGLDLVNVGVDEPQAQHRNKPWFKTISSDGMPKGIYVWNETADAWENLSPVDAAVLLETISDALAIAGSAEKTAREAKAEADRAKEFADNSFQMISDAKARADEAEQAAETASSNYSGVRFGHMNNVIIPRALGAHYTLPYQYSPPLAASPTPVGFVTLTADSHPHVPFRIGVEVNAGASTMRGIGYNVLDAGSDRTVSFMWMIKGNNIT